MYQVPFVKYFSLVHKNDNVLTVKNYLLFMCFSLHYITEIEDGATQHVQWKVLFLFTCCQGHVVLFTIYISMTTHTLAG